MFQTLRHATHVEVSYEIQTKAWEQPVYSSFYRNAARYKQPMHPPKTYPSKHCWQLACHSPVTKWYKTVFTLSSEAAWTIARTLAAGGPCRQSAQSSSCFSKASLARSERPVLFSCFISVPKYLACSTRWTTQATCKDNPHQD